MLYAYYTSSCIPNYKLLKACTLVCRIWSGPARILLFRSSTNLTRRTISKFRTALLSSTAWGLKTFKLGDCVRTLDVSIGRTIHEGCCLDDFVKLFQACPRVYELVLGFSGIVELEEETLKKLKIAGQRLKALHLALCEPLSPIPFQLLHIWPNIQFLKMGHIISVLPRAKSVHRRNAADDVEEFVQRYASGAKVCLYDLMLYVKFPTAHVLTWLLASSAYSLRILDLRGILRPLYPLAFARSAPRLRSLRLSEFCRFTSNVHCTRRAGYLSYACNPTSTRSSTHHRTLCVQERPQSWQHAPAHSLNAVDALPQLRILTCDKKSERIAVHYEILIAKCRMKGVEVVVSHIPWVEDPVAVDRFPRSRSVSNFIAMNGGKQQAPN
ncbi:hypothetical protein M405DRAFT_592792 [Rhizopogon salebrosus TDB-379]|nr:hypothetical protein M405DRAFT_592792 [Rhizopogon salebrosus TDB-379]